jgi:signal peptidase II
LTTPEPAQPLPGAERRLVRGPDMRVGSATDGLTPLAVAERSLAASLTQWLALASIALAAVGADQLTKYVVASSLSLEDGLHVVGPFWIHHVRNSGIAFGLFASATPVVIVLTGVAVAWMLAYFARAGARHPVLPIALGLVIGGSVSNLLDRVRLGYVTDFLDFRYWPAFNLADSFIVIGVGILLAALVAVDRAPRPPRGARGPGPPAGRRRLGLRRSQPQSRPFRDAPARR